MTGIAIALVIWLAVQLGAVSVAYARWVRRRRTCNALLQRARSVERQRVLVLRPCAGHESHLEATLRSTTALQCDGDVTYVFAVGSESDPAYAIADTVATELQRDGYDAHLVVTHARGPNHKVDQLTIAIARHERAEPEFVVVVDSDVEVSDAMPQSLLDSMIGVLQNDPKCAACWVPFVEVPASDDSWGDAVSQAVLGASFHSTAFLAGIDPDGMTGKCFAVRGSALQQAGGFASLVSFLGEDMELARRFVANGKHVFAAPQAVRSRAQGRTVRDVLARFSRWVWVIRAQRPTLLMGYPLMLAASPLQFCACVAVMVSSLPVGCALVVLTLGIRFIVALAAHAIAMQPIQPFRRGRMALAVFAADWVLLCAWARACMSRRIFWRGRELRVRNGVLTYLDENNIRSAETAM